MKGRATYGHRANEAQKRYDAGALNANSGFKGARNNLYRLRWLIGVMSNEAWRAVYGHSLDKRHNKKLITRNHQPEGFWQKHQELCCRIGCRRILRPYPAPRSECFCSERKLVWVVPVFP